MQKAVYIQAGVCTTVVAIYLFSHLVTADQTPFAECKSYLMFIAPSLYHTKYNRDDGRP